MELVAQCVHQLTHADSASVYCVAGDKLVCTADTGDTDTDPVGTHRSFYMEDDLAAQCLRSHEVIEFTDLEADPRVDSRLRVRAQTRSLLMLPIVHQGQALGVLAIGARTARAFGPLALSTVQIMSGMLGAALSHSELLSERQRAEIAALDAAEHLRAVLRAATQFCIIGTDLRGTITVFNTGAERMLGYSAEEVIGRTTPERFHAWEEMNRLAAELGVPPTLAVVVAAARRTETDTREWTFIRKDGSSLKVLYAVAEMHGSTGEPIGYIGFAVDVTERHRIEQLKSEFVGVVSHELRTPLTSIRGSLGLVAAGLLGPIPEPAQHMLDIAVTNSDRLIRLITDFLDIERIESGRATMEIRVIDARELATRSIESLQTTADAAGIALACDAESFALPADPDRIQQTLVNLIGNAIKFSPDGSTITVSAHSNGPHAFFSVRDEGRGIPPDKLTSIFERFEQVDSGDAREKGGAGLGLAISRSIVQQHGGRIWVDSVQGRGSTFSFTLPGALSVATPEPEGTLRE
jgi:PAS domain S-box-containing protein